MLDKEYFAWDMVGKIIYKFGEKMVFVVVDGVGEKNVGEMLVGSDLEEEDVWWFLL